MTSQLEIDSVVAHNYSVIKVEGENRNKNDNTLVSEYSEVFDSCTTVYHDPPLQKLGNDYNLHDHENKNEEILHNKFPAVERRDGNDTKDFDLPLNDGKKKNIGHISEEVIIKTEENIKTIDHQEEENYYELSRVKIEIDDTTEQKNNESKLEPHPRIANPSEQELPGDYYYRLPESYYTTAPLIPDPCSVREEINKIEMQQNEQNASEVKDTNSLLKVKKLPKPRTASKYESNKKNKNKQYRCFICFASYRQFSAYLRHKNEHLKKGTNQILRKRREGKHLKMIRGIAHFQCDKCNKSYTCEASLKVHIKMSHGHIPIEVIKTEPEDIAESDYSNLTNLQMNTVPQEQLFSASQHDDIQRDSGPSLLKMSSELETIKYSILLLQQDSINAAEDRLNEVNKTYNCPECLKFFDRAAFYRSHLNGHLKKKFMLLRNQKMGLLKTLKDISKFPYFSYNSGYIANINANKHLRSIETERKTDYCVLGESTNNSNGMKETIIKDTVQRESFEKHSSHSIVENDVLNDKVSVLPSNSLEFASPKTKECDETKTYSCSKCSENCLGSSVFREHLNQHLKEEMMLLHKKKREMYSRHMLRTKSFKCEKCDKEYLYDGFLKKHRKFCQGPPRNELKDMFIGYNITSDGNLNKNEVEFHSQKNNTDRSNIKSSCDPAQNINTAIAASEGSILQYDECRFTSPSDSTSKLDGFGVYSSNSERKTTIDAIMALINDTQHVCPKCPRVFESLSLYWHHLNKHYDRERHMLFCKKLYNERNTHTNKFYKCDQCDKSYVHKNRLDLHINSQHRIPVLPDDNKDISDNKEYKCTCGKSYSRKSRMATCFKSHTMAKELPRCIHCKYHFQNNEELNIHRNFMHTEHRYLCKFCPVEYYTVDDLLGHLEIHKKIQQMECKVIAENIEEKQYLKCFICKQISNDLNEFKLHFLNDHRKPYLCTICVKNFNDLNQFMSHTNTYHLSSRERWLLELLQAFFALMQSWECKPCNFHSENPDALAEHLYDHRILNVVGLDLIPKSENLTSKRKCVDCRRIYSSNKQFEEHRGLYHNPNQGIKKKRSLYVKTKKEDVTMKCLKCNIQFNSEGHLKAHFSTLRHVEMQSFLLNEQFVSASMHDVESNANVIVTID